MGLRDHWDSVYKTKCDAELSWTQLEPRTSLELIHDLGPAGRVIDVGGGTSLLAERLLTSGYDVSVLDISSAAIERARKRLGARADQIHWMVADITADTALGTFDIWHDRAFFHFLTEPADRAAYIEQMSRAIVPGGHAMIATFAVDGPAKCSGLEVRRYDAQSLTVELGTRFQLVKSTSELHTTPAGKPQAFQYSVFRRI